MDTSAGGAPDQERLSDAITKLAGAAMSPKAEAARLRRAQRAGEPIADGQPEDLELPAEEAGDVAARVLVAAALDETYHVTVTTRPADGSRVDSSGPTTEQAERVRLAGSS